VALAMVLPSVIEFNAPARGAELAEVGDALGADKQETEEDGGRVAADAVRALLSQLGMPATLGAVGFTQAMVGSLVSGALEDVVLRNNPIQATQAELALLVESLF
jgi:alcohol dehydrogenase class IV